MNSEVAPGVEPRLLYRHDIEIMLSNELAYLLGFMQCAPRIPGACTQRLHAGRFWASPSGLRHLRGEELPVVQALPETGFWRTLQGRPRVERWSATPPHRLRPATRGPERCLPLLGFVPPLTRLSRYFPAGLHRPDFGHGCPDLTARHSPPHHLRGDWGD